MEVRNLSPTKLKQSRLCEARLLARYGGDEDYSEDKGERALLGTLAHKAAELWFRPDPQWVKQILTASAGLAESATSREEYYAQYDRLVADLAARGVLKHPLPDRQEGESDEQLRKRAFNECFQRAIEQSKPAELPDEPASVEEAKDCFGTIVAAYDREKIDVVFTERVYKGTVGGGVPVHCILDLGINRRDGTIEIVDYKTGFMTMSAEEMHSEDQVLVDLLAARQDRDLAGFDRHQFTYFWAQHASTSGPVWISDDRLTDYEYWLTIKYQYLLNLTEETATETINSFCPSCGRRDKCKVYGQLLAEAMGMAEGITPEQAEAMDLEGMMAIHSKLHAQEKFILDSRKTISKMLLAHLEDNHQTKHEGDLYSVSRQQRSGVDYSVADVLEVCQQRSVDPSRVLTVSTGRLKSVFADDEAAMRQLNERAIKSPQSAYVVVREISANKERAKRSPKKKTDGDKK